MRSNAVIARLLVFWLAGTLLAEVKPTEAERQLAQKIAALPADEGTAAVAETESAQITAGLAQALADMSLAEHDRAKAVRLAQLALEVARRGNFLEMVAAAHAALGRALNAQANYYQATENYGRALEEYQQSGGAPSSIYRLLTGRAISRMHLGDLEGALDDDQRALALAVQTTDEVTVARIFNGMGNLYRQMGDFRRSLEAFEQSLKIAQKNGEKLGESYVLNNIGAVYADQGDYRLAIDYAKRSLQIKESLGRTDDTISSLTNLGSNYDRAGRYLEARQSLDKALHMARGTGQKSRIAEVLSVAARIDLEHGRPTAGLAKLQEGAAICRENGERLNEANILTDMAEALFDGHRYEEALAAALRARDLSRETSGTALLADAVSILGQTYRAMGKAVEARAALTEGIALTEEVRDNVGGGESEREFYLASRTDAYRELLALEMQERHTEAAFRLAERAKGRVLLDLLRGGRPSLERTMSAEERAVEVNLRGRLATLRAQREAAGSGEALPEARLAEMDARIEKARSDLSAFRATLYAAHPELRSARADVPPIALAEAAQLLPSAATALLEYVVTPTRTYLFAIARGPAGPVLRAHAIPVAGEALMAAAVRFREQIASRDPGFVETARKLHGWLLELAAKDLAGKTALVIVPDGELWHLPFQALQTPAGRFLVQDAAISYAPSLSVMHALLQGQPVAEGKPRTLLALADPAGDTPEAGREADAVARLYGAANTRMWRGSAASSEVFRANAGAFDIVHLAAHGVFDDRNPMGSHIVLAAPAKGSREDGWVEAGEVRYMNLKAALVVLSGCETARGRFENGEGSIGLNWSFWRRARGPWWPANGGWSPPALRLSWSRFTLAYWEAPAKPRRCGARRSACWPPSSFTIPFIGQASCCWVRVPERLRREATTRSREPTGSLDWHVPALPIPAGPPRTRQLGQTTQLASSGRPDIVGGPAVTARPPAARAR
jgi:CHAT domain-containing protein